MERAIPQGVRPTLVGTEPGALLAGATILFALQERGIEPRLAIYGEDPLAEPLSRALRARSLACDIVSIDTIDGIDAPILIGSGGALDLVATLSPPECSFRRDGRSIRGEPTSRQAPSEHARLALVGLGAEVCGGIDPEHTAARLAACLADGSLIARTLLRPHDTVARAWIELVEDVHHDVGPARQLPIVDAIRAALFGRHGRVAVDLAARERPALVTLETASILWIDPARMSPHAPPSKTG